MTEPAPLNAPPDGSPRVVPRSAHNISRANISRNALKVLYRLREAGFQAFIVGGGVRDLLLGRHPKDFDIATDASPEEVRSLFGNCRLVGRRFRLAHVRFRDEIVEVATFRGLGGEDMDGEERHVLDETTGRILKDNAYGSIEEDAWRRDFTVNALFYNIADFSVWDYVGGMDDVAARCIRLIGDPETRYREDPVRMIRAARFAAKLGMELHADSAAPVGRLASLIDGVPPARLFDEFLKVFETGHALESFRQLRRLGLFEHLFPATAAWLDAGPGDGRRQRFLESALRETDYRVLAELPVTPMFLFGVFLWGPVRERALAIQATGTAEVPAMIQAAMEVTQEQVQRIALPKRFSIPMREMLQLQLKLERRQGRRAAGLVAHRRFRAAYDLYLLRLELGETTREGVEFWARIQAEVGVPDPGTDDFSGEDEDPAGQPPPRRGRGPRGGRGRRPRTRSHAEAH